MTNLSVIASDRAFRVRARQSHLYEKNHPSTALRVTLDEIAALACGGFAMTAPGVYLHPHDLKITRAQQLRNMIGTKIKAF